MQKRFFDILNDIKTNQLTNIVGLWLLVGDEPLVQNWVIDAFRPIFYANHQIIKRNELISTKSWQGIVDELGSLSLFAENTALLATGKQKCDEKILGRLMQFADDVKTGSSGHCLIYQLPKQDKKEQAGKLYKLFATHGIVVDCHLYHEKDRRQLLGIKADEFGLNLSNQAWQWLMTQTENNLLTAHQALWRASDLYANQNTWLDIEHLLPILVSDYQYSTFELSNQLLLGNTQKALQILHHLKQTNTAPSLVLWAIAKEIRTLLQLQSGKSPSELGIWQNRWSLYQSAQSRPINHTLLDGVYRIDQSIKGLSDDDVWFGLERLCLTICGVL